MLYGILPTEIFAAMANLLPAHRWGVGDFLWKSNFFSKILDISEEIDKIDKT